MKSEVRTNSNNILEDIMLQIKFPELNPFPNSEAISYLHKKVEEDLKEFKVYAKIYSKKFHEKSQKLLAEYAKKHDLECFYKEDTWIFEAKSGEKISMPQGHYIKKDGVLHQVAIDY